MRLGKFGLIKNVEDLHVAFINNSKGFIDNLISGKYDDSLLNDRHIIYPEKKITLPVLNVIPSDPTKNDFINAVKLYEALEDIDLDEANDPRLWVYLSSKCYPSYIKQRWKPQASTVREHYFFGSSSATSNVSNAISKLWWGVNQTVIKGEADRRKKYLYTKMYFKYTDIVQAIGERKDIFKNRELVKAILETVYLKPVYPAPTTKILSKFILNHIKSTNIDFMNRQELNELVNEFYEYSKRFIKSIDEIQVTRKSQILEQIEF
tara:strand:+ start:502 stop:1293 length:792 start_codon:yes stop_codon:yes gene_type:complete